MDGVTWAIVHHNGIQCRHTISFHAINVCLTVITKIQRCLNLGHYVLVGLGIQNVPDVLARFRVFCAMPTGDVCISIGLRGWNPELPFVVILHYTIHVWKGNPKEVLCDSSFQKTQGRMPCFLTATFFHSQGNDKSGVTLRAILIPSVHGSHSLTGMVIPLNLGFDGSSMVCDIFLFTRKVGGVTLLNSPLIQVCGFSQTFDLT